MKFLSGLVICFIGLVLTNLTFDDFSQTGNIILQTAGFAIIIAGLYVIIKGRKQQ